MTSGPVLCIGGVALVASVASFGSSCAGTKSISSPSPRATVPLAASFEQRVGQSVRLTGEPLVVTLERVAEDSRCPAGGSCIWAGDAVLRLSLRGSGTGNLDLHTFSSPPEGLQFGRYRVHLVRLAPAAREGGIPQDAYVATLRIEKR